MKGKEYFEKMFPTLDGVRGFRIAGETVSEIAPQVKNEIGDDFKPARLFVYYVGRSLRLSEIPDLDEMFGPPERLERGLILSDLPLGRLVVYVFYSNEL